MSIRRSTCIWVAATSTASTISAGIGKSPFRPKASFATAWYDLNLFQVRNNKGQMVPLGTLVTPREIGGPISVHALQSVHRRVDQRQRAAGVSTGDAIDDINRPPAETLPLSMKAEWTEFMFMQIRAGNTAMYVFLAVHRVRVPGTGGAVRKLVAAAGGDPGGATVPALFGGRRVVDATAMSTSSCRSAWWCWSAWHAKTRS